MEGCVSVGSSGMVFLYWVLGGMGVFFLWASNREGIKEAKRMGNLSWFNGIGLSFSKYD